MKKTVAAFLAVSLLGTSALAAPPRHDDHGRGPGYHAPQPQNQYRNWRKGDRFDYRHARNYRVISRPQSYHLRPAPRGYHWVQSGNDAVLVAIAGGVVASVLAGAIH